MAGRILLQFFSNCLYMLLVPIAVAFVYRLDDSVGRSLGISLLFDDSGKFLHFELNISLTLFSASGTKYFE